MDNTISIYARPIVKNIDSVSPTRKGIYLPITTWALSLKQVVIVTGHSGGIGSTISAQLIEEGYIVIGIDKRLSGNCTHEINQDLSDLDDNDQTSIERCLDEGRGVHPILSLINCAAVQITGEFNKISRAQLLTSFKTNTLAPFSLSKICLPRMVPNGCIINIGSIHTRLTKSGFLPYSVSKSALTGLTRALALELGNQIRVIELQPGAVATDMLEAGFEANQAARALLDEYHPTGRIGRPEEIAELCALIIKHPIAFMNGATIPVDGGISGALKDPD